MSGRIVVGYTATDAGADALALGVRMAAASASVLDVVMVLPNEDRSVITPPAASYNRHLRDTAAEWLQRARETVSDAVRHDGHVRHAESFAEGLVAAAGEFDASYIVVGAANGGLRGRHRLGTVASELMHYSDVPVVLAPEGAREVDVAEGVSRVTAAVGTRPGGDVLLAEAVALAAATGATLRLLSLATVDLPAGVDTGVIRLTGETHADAVLAQARAALPADVAADVVTATGDSIEEAVQRIDWLPGEIAMVGSSRLAQPRRLFLGSTAAKMLHVLPVPMVVVPRTRGGEGARS
ncbi:universal stress protein [Microbacterium sp. cx-55]|uniref:universal stress protein n=1 Tax=Microbacterium sp. cx-55 TaxID=2875948 RepID=UPI001CBB8E29|nr:universal stress protein [Microbacterium sp. cx-55]MBZ4487920.1 universal stress protein [Microbacterium sp. cx-55]UGB34669.1 universal stress protein [Microbacterium sp. cx-55]